MDKPTIDTSLKCKVTTSPSCRPVLHRVLSRKPVMKVNPEEAIEYFQRDNNEKEVYRMGETLRDLSLACQYLNVDDKIFLEGLLARQQEAYIYSSIPGSIQQSCPLTRGVNGDPNNGTYTASLATGTTVYFPRPDSSSICYLEETDFANEPIIADGLQNHSQLSSTLGNELPLGDGVAILAQRKNLVKNSGLADDGTDIYNWTLSGAGGAGGLTRYNSTGWMGVPSLQIWGTNVWTADGFDVSDVTSQEVCVSLGWKTDGVILVEVDYNDGGGWGTLMSLGPGDGYIRTAKTVTALANNMDVRFSLSSGTYGEICAFQVVKDSTPQDMSFYYPYLEGYGDGIQGEITGCQLKYDVQAYAGMWTDSPTNDSVLIVSGYIQPLTKGNSMDDTYKIFTLHNSLTSKEFELHMRTSGSDLRLYLRSNATALTDKIVTGFSYGDTVLVAMVVGWESGTATKGIFARVVGADTTYSSEVTGTSNFYTQYDELFIGTDHNGNQGADALFQDVNVWSGTLTPCCQIDDFMEYYSDPDNLVEARTTLGRKYLIIPRLIPNRWNVGKYDGTLECVNTKVI